MQPTPSVEIKLHVTLTSRPKEKKQSQKKAHKEESTQARRDVISAEIITEPPGKAELEKKMQKKFFSWPSGKDTLS